jgi:hypothetical protein
VQDAIEAIAKRAELIGDWTETGDFCLRGTVEQGRLLAGRGPEHDGRVDPDLLNPYGSDGPKKGTSVKAVHSPGLERRRQFTCLNSLREVEPPVKFIISDGGLDEITGEATPDATPEAPKAEGGQAWSSSSHMRKSEVGEARPSQTLTTYGIGSLVDLPNMSVIVMGLDDWPSAHSTRSLRNGCCVRLSRS